MTKNIIIGVLVVALLGMTWLAWRNSQPMRCDEVIQYEDGSAVCEVFIRESVNPGDVQRNGVKEGYRI